MSIDLKSSTRESLSKATKKIGNPRYSYQHPESACSCYLIDVRKLILNTTHELGNDLTAIMMACDLITRTSATNNGVMSCVSEVLESARRAQDYCHQLNRLCAKVSCELRELNLNQTIESVFLRLQNQLEERRIRVEVRAPYPICCCADPLLLERTLENIMLMTIRTTPLGGTVSIWLKQWRTKACIEIINDGTKTGVETLNYLIDPLSRSCENSCAERLMLAETIAILKLMRGTIRVRKTSKNEPVAQLLLIKG